MEGKTSWIVAGVLGLALLWLVFRQQQGGTTTAISRTPPPTQTDQLHMLTNQAADLAGAITAKAIPGGTGLTKPVQSAARSYINGTISGFKQAGTGVQQIASGNVWGGAKNIGLGAAETAYTATGAKGVVDYLKGVL